MQPDDGISHAGRRRRLRERVMRGGSEDMTDRELLEFLLGYALPRVDVNPLGHRLMDAFGTLDGVLHAPRGEITKINGAGERVADFLAAYAAVADGVIEGPDAPASPGEDGEIAKAMAALKALQGPAVAVMKADSADSGCQAREWPCALPEGGALWLIGAAARLNANRLTLIWRWDAQSLDMPREDSDAFVRVQKLLSPAGVALKQVYLMNDAGQWRLYTMS